ncbi:MAG: CBS domain-containing protein [Sulfolobaceae archaeon]|jgi:FOG: CBS domain|nr:CBS domain-containing protein [Sulfolobales archaeon]
MSEALVKDYMRQNVVTAEKSATLRQLAELMAKNNTGSVVVAEGGKPVGIVTERDIVKAIGNGKGLDTKAEEIMSSKLHTVREDTPISGALSVMRTFNIRHLPVVDEKGYLKGIVSIRDLARAIDDLLSGEYSD